MSQILQTDEWTIFFKVVEQIGQYKYGAPKKKYPRYVSFQKIDKHLPGDNILESGPNAIRAYWNSKNLRKRQVKK